MSRIVSALKRLPDNGLAQDICGLVVMFAFCCAAIYGLAGLTEMVAAARALP